MSKNIRLKKVKTFIFSAVILTLSLILATGCGPLKNQGDIAQSQETEEEATSEETAMQETEDTATTEQETDKSQEIESKFNLLEKTAENIEEIFNFIDENIKVCNPDLAVNMVYTVIKLCEDYKFAFTDKFNDQEVQNTIYELSPSMEELNLEFLKNTDNIKVKDIIEEAINKKYKLMSVEGFVMPLVDYEAYDTYRQYLTQEMNDYLDIKLDESDRPSVMDAGIVIPIDDFIQRILKSMKYLEDYPDSPRFGEIKQFNDGRIYMYLSGIDNNPVFDSSQKILASRLAEFESNLDKYGDTKFGEILGSYLDLLEQESYIRTTKVDDFLSNISSF